MDKKIIKNFWFSIVRAPYPNLPWLVLAYVIACALILHHGGIFTGHLIGYDDQVRMTQVLNWVNGAGFYDRTIMRANPPEGFTSIWSRIVDMPIALVVIIFQQFVPQKVAALVAAAVIPMVELAILFVAAPYFVRPLVGKDKARLIVLFLIFTSLLNLKHFSASGFIIGQVSHHPWYVILDLVMFGAAARLALGSAHLSPRLMLGGSIALLTAVGIEGYPMIAATTGILALVAWAQNRPFVAKRGGDSILIGALLSLLLLPLHQRPENLLTVSFAEPSILGVILVTAAGLFLKFEQFTLRYVGKEKIISAIALCSVAALNGVILVSLFPDMLNGAAAGLSPAERTMALMDHYEAQSVFKVSSGPVDFACLIIPTLIAFVAGLWSLRRTRGRKRAMRFCYFAFAVFAGYMSEIFSRYYHHAMTTACAWLLWVWEGIKKRLKKNINYTLLALLSYMALGPFWMLFVYKIMYDSPLTTQLLLFPAAVQASPDSCDSLPIANYINDHYSKDTLLVVPYWLSAQFLYQVDVRLDFLSNYPSHDKFIDNFVLFGGRDLQSSKSVIMRHGIDLVAICKDPYLWDPRFEEGFQLFLARLQRGHAPPWLKPVQTNIQANYLLYEVDKASFEKKAP